MMISQNINKRVKKRICLIPIIVGLLLERGHVSTSEKGLMLIGNAERCYREAYYCPAGILTDGIGNTHNVKLKIIKSNENIAKDWEENILEAEACVNRYAMGRKLSENIFSSAVEITFNVGCTKIKNSTFFRLLREGKFYSACEELPRWIHMNGKKLEGLIIRRNQSKSLCLEGIK